MTWYRNAALLVLSVALALAGPVAGAAVAAGGGPGPQPAAFRIHLDGTQLSARTYALVGEGKGAGAEYMLRISMGLTSDAPTAALQPGHSFGTATVEILDQTGTVLSTFTLGEPKVVLYQQSGDASAGTVDVDVALKAKSFAAS